MYAHITAARLVRLGFSREEIRRALRCCLRRVARGRYVTEFVCADAAHSELWESIKSGSSSEFVQFGDIRDQVERLKVLEQSIFRRVCSVGVLHVEEKSSATCPQRSSMNCP